MKRNYENVCLYFHINILKQEIFYVGIGNPKRPYDIKERDHNKFWNRTVDKYGVYLIYIVHKNIPIDIALKKEAYYIKKIGRRNLGLGTLVNLTDGGEAFRNIKFTEEHKQNISKARKGFKMSEETKKKISNTTKGRKLTEEDKKNKSIAQMGHKLSEETKRKISETRKAKGIKCWNKGLKATKQAKEKFYKSIQKRKESGIYISPLLGQPKTETTKTKMSIAKKGKKLSEQHKANISEALKKKK